MQSACPLPPAATLVWVCVCTHSPLLGCASVCVCVCAKAVNFIALKLRGSTSVSYDLQFSGQFNLPAALQNQPNSFIDHQ